MYVSVRASREFSLTRSFGHNGYMMQSRLSPEETVGALTSQIERLEGRLKVLSERLEAVMRVLDTIPATIEDQMQATATKTACMADALTSMAELVLALNTSLASMGGDARRQAETLKDAAEAAVEIRGASGTAMEIRDSLIVGSKNLDQMLASLMGKLRAEASKLDPSSSVRDIRQILAKR